MPDTRGPGRAKSISSRALPGDTDCEVRSENSRHRLLNSIKFNVEQLYVEQYDAHSPQVLFEWVKVSPGTRTDTQVAVCKGRSRAHVSLAY